MKNGEVEVVIHEEEEIDRIEWPEARSSLYSQLTFNYITPLLEHGASSSSLQAEDLPRVSRRESAYFIRQAYRSCNNPDRVKFALVGAGKSALYAAAGWQLLVSTCLVVEPLLLREVILAASIKKWRISLFRGLVAAALIGANSTIKAFSQQRQIHLSTRAGQRIRALALTEIYATVLRGSSNTSSIATLAGVDATKLFEVSLDLHLVWAAPIMVIVISLLLVIVVGDILAAFSGVACLVAVLPLAKLLTQKLISLRQAKAPLTDKRVQEVGEVIAGIRITKLSGWESLWLERWKNKRMNELVYTRQEMLFTGISLLLVVMSPVIATVVLFSVAMNTDRNARITPAKAFTVVSLIGSVRFPLNKLGILVGQVAQAWRALDRIAAFVRLEQALPENTRDHHHTDDADSKDGIELSVRNASFVRRLPTGKESFVTGRHKRLDLDVHRGDLVLVYGQVASGKSSLLFGLLRELEAMEPTQLNLRTGARVAVATQEPCVLNATLRDNVLFGAPLPMDQEKYYQALTACQLDRDIEGFPASDLTEIGERGITLSGGQKARISLARVVYSGASIALLDDVLSALDAKTQRDVFDSLFGDRGILKDTAVVFVTHAAHFAPRASTIIVLDENGDVAFKGNWNELCAKTQQENDHLLAPLVQAARHYKSSSDLDSLVSATSQDQAFTKSTAIQFTKIVHRRENNDDQLRKAASATLIKKEKREKGMASLSTWLKWSHAAGGSSFLSIQFILLVIDRSFYVATEWWLARWADAREKDTNIFGHQMPSQREGLSSAMDWSRVYLILAGFSTLFCFLRTQWGFYAGVTAGKQLYERVSQSVLNAPQGWFDETPIGRTISRFSFDTEQVDIQLTQKASMFLISVGWAVTGIIVQIALSRGVMAACIIPIFYKYFYLQLFYRKSSVDLQRLDAVSRTPLQQLLAEAVEASVTIRAFGVHDSFDQRFLQAVDKNTQSLLAWTTSQRWIGLRLDLYAAAVATFAAIMIACLRRRLGLTPAFSGMLMIWSLQLTTTFMFLVTTSVEAEMAVTSVERMTEDIPNEFYNKPKVSIPAIWPSRGHIEFKNVCMRYRAGLPCALQNLDLSIPAGKRCAIVGRTGSGKTSTIVALFRLFPTESGTILVDNLSILETDLQQCRTRMAKLIPQDPVLFTGDIRKNIDPFDNYTDDEVSRAIHLVFQNDTSIELSTHVEEGGKNFSAGERQLLALARALVSRPKILCLDEATSSLDQSTDQMIQQLLRSLPELEDTTVLCVAHRLFTVIDYNVIAVLEQGRCVEYGSPHELATSSGFFSDLIDATGPETAATLRHAALLASQ